MRPVRPLLSAALALVLNGCGRSTVRVGPPADGGAARKPIELFAWLESVGDSDPVAALAATHRQRHPDDTIISARAASSGQARRVLRARIARHDPPDTFQVNVGDDLMQWVLVNGVDAAESKLVPLDDAVPESASWRDAIPAPLLERVSYQGRIYGVPADLHRNNTVFYNKHVFAQYGLAEPASVADLLALGKTLRGRVPLFAVGSREPWTLSLFLFECLLVSREGSDFYRDFFSQRRTPDDPRIVDTLQAGLELLAFANPDHGQLSWLQAVEMVTRGEAAMTVMGECARAPFIAAGMKPGVDFGEIPFPGTAGVFVFSADAFGLPVDARNRAGAERLLATIGSIEGQRAISRARGTLSARIDVPPAGEDPMLAQDYALFQQGRLVMALSGMLPASVSDDLDASLGEMLDKHDVEPVVQTLRSRYALLK